MHCALRMKGKLIMSIFLVSCRIGFRWKIQNRLAIFREKLNFWSNQYTKKKGTIFYLLTWKNQDKISLICGVEIHRWVLMGLKKNKLAETTNIGKSSALEYCGQKTCNK